MVFLFELTRNGIGDLTYEFRHDESYTSNLAQPAIDVLTSKKDFKSKTEAREIALNTLENSLYELGFSKHKEGSIQKLVEEIEEQNEILKNTKFFCWYIPWKKGYWKSSPEGNVKNIVKKVLYDVISLDFTALLTYDLLSKDFEKNKYSLLAGILIPKLFSELKRGKLRRGSKKLLEALTEYKGNYEDLKKDYSTFKKNILEAEINILYTEKADKFLKFLQNGESSETSEETSEFPKYSREETPEINEYLVKLYKERLRKKYEGFVFGF